MIVERHSGYIKYESELGVGTVFSVDLPMVAMEADAGTNVKQTADVLVCENNHDMGVFLEEVMNAEGVSYALVETVGAALNRLAQCSYSLLVVNTSVLEPEKPEFLGNLKQLLADSELAMVVISTYSQNQEDSLGYCALKVLDTLKEPVDKQLLRRAIRKALRSVKRPRILHIEDDPDIIHIAHSVLEEFADVSQAFTLREARRQLDEHCFDLILLDLVMPDGYGEELLNDLDSTAPPVIVFSAETPKHSIAARVSTTLTESVTNNEQLKSTVCSVLNIENNKALPE